MPRVYEQHEADIGMHAVITVAAYRLWTVFDTVTRTNHASAQYVVVINDKFWRGLTKDQQAIVIGAARAADSEAANLTADNKAVAYEQIARNGRLKVVDLSDEDLMLWRIGSTGALMQFVNRTGSRGQKLMSAYARLRERSCCSQKSSFQLNLAEHRGPGF